MNILNEYKILRVLSELKRDNTYDGAVSNQNNMLELYTWLVEDKILESLEQEFILKAFPENTNPEFNYLEASRKGGSLYLVFTLVKSPSRPVSFGNIIAQYKIRMSDHRTHDNLAESFANSFVEDPFADPSQAQIKG